MPGPTYLSIVEIPGDGVTTQHEFNFAGGYINRTHVKAVVYDALGGITPITVTDEMFVTDFVIDIGVAAPVGGKTRIYRETPKDGPLVDFYGGARVTEKNLDLVAQQTVFAAAEAFDAGAYAQVNDLLSQAGISAAAAADAATAAADAAATATVAAASIDPDTVMRLIGNQTVAGIKTMTSSPVVPAGASGAQVPQAQEVGALAVAQRALGTVSQAAGVPTGHILETATNARGTYVKFADGTMICWHRATVTDQAIDSAYGSLFHGIRAWTFPATFASEPVVKCGEGKWGTGASWPGSISSVTTTAATLRFMDVLSRDTGTSFTFAASAHGRWF